MSAYCSLHGLVLTDVVDIDGVSVSGGGRNIDSLSSSGMSYATVLEAGHDAATYSFEIHSTTRADIERARQEINTAPSGAEFCPFDSDQVAYVQQSYATPAKITKIAGGGQIYYSEATVVCENELLYGADAGIAFQRNVPLPKTATIANAGYYPSGLDCLTMSGGYDAPKYTTDAYFSIGSDEVSLCQRLMRGDRFTLDRFGNCLHEYETTFKKTYAEQQIDLLGSTFCDYGTSGSIAEGALVIGASGKILVPFYGPLLCNVPPHLEVDITAIAGAPTVQIAYSSDLSDLEEIDCDTLVVGKNEIDFPLDAVGEAFLAIGIVTGSDASIQISSLDAHVERYCNVNDLPTIEEGESATLTVGDGETSNHLLSFLIATYRDIF